MPAAGGARTRAAKTQETGASARPLGPGASALALRLGREYRNKGLPG